MKLAANRGLVRPVICATCAAVTLAAVAAAQAAEESPAQPDPSRWDKTISTFQTWDSKNSVPKEGVLFVGSSSIRLWATQQCFPQFTVVNRGFGGSHISDVSHFTDRIVLPYKPRVIVFYAGDNDIASGKSPQRVLDDYRAFVNLVQDQLPATRIVYIAIKPSLKRWSKWPLMKEANALIEKATQEDTRLAYANVAEPMLGDNGEPRGEFFVKDGLHLNAEGYKLWTKVVTPLIEAALND